jgi:raffinose/stachyose/melibiose transport system permease protein
MFANSVPVLGEKLGIGWLSTNLLANEDLAWVAILTVAVWQAVAFNIIIYLAGLQTIPAEVYEASKVDGAGPWRQFRSITFPLIMPFFTINMVLALKGFIQVFDHIIALTNGGPGTATTSVALQIYRGGFQGGEYAYQTANAIIFFIVIVVLSLAQLKFLQSRESDI